jgi:hypothetical protein
MYLNSFRIDLLVTLAQQNSFLSENCKESILEQQIKEAQNKGGR